jgi:hypothetical protein
VDEQPMIYAFTVAELERLVDWGHCKELVIYLEPEDYELLERIKRLVVAAGEGQRRAH